MDNIWKNLGEVYLTNNEMKDANTKDKRSFYKDIIKYRLLKDVWKRMKKNGEVEPPFISSFNSKFISQDRRTLIHETDKVSKAKITLRSNKFYIYLNKNQSEPEKRIQIAHELGHTFLYNVDEIPIQSYSTEKKYFDIFSNNNSEIQKLYSRNEAFVYEIGRHILIPSEVLEKKLPSQPSLISLLNACNPNNFFVSKEVMAKRLFWDIHDWKNKLTYWPNAILIFYPKIKHENNEPPKGNSEVYRGTNLRDINIQKDIWKWIKPMIEISLNNPKRIIYSTNIESSPSLKIRDHNILAEIKYSPEGDFIYTLIIDKNGKMDFLKQSQQLIENYIDI